MKPKAERVNLPAGERVDVIARSSWWLQTMYRLPLDDRDLAERIKRQAWHVHHAKGVSLRVSVVDYLRLYTAAGRTDRPLPKLEEL